MESKSENKSTKQLSWLTISFVISLAALVMIVIAGRASASPLDGGGTGIPLPPPTVPATVPAHSPTPHGTTTTVPGSTSTPHATTVPASTPTRPGPQPTTPPAGCTVSFSDVHTTDWFYESVSWMYCHGVISGYADNTFRPNNPTTRAQILKIVIGAFNMTLHIGDAPSFEDVPTTDIFYDYVETANYFGFVSGYECGGPNEPCDSQNRPYFRPNNQVTRGQLTKIVVLAAIQARPAVWQLLNPPTPSFADVGLGTTFYTYIETAVAHSLISGYNCGGPAEPCPGRYFRVGNNATRAQLSKIVYQAATQP